MSSKSRRVGPRMRAAVEFVTPARAARLRLTDRRVAAASALRDRLLAKLDAHVADVGMSSEDFARLAAAAKLMECRVKNLTGVPLW